MQKTPSIASNAKYKLRLVKGAIPSKLVPHLGSNPEDRKTLRRGRRRKGLTNNKAIVEHTPRINRISKEGNELLHRINEEQIRISTNIEHLKTYGPHYYTTKWNKHYRVLKQANGESNPLNWSTEEVASFIRKVGLSDEIAVRFKEQTIDGSALLDLSKEDLQHLVKIKLGPSIKISHLIEKLRRKVCEKFVVFDEFAHLNA